MGYSVPLAIASGIALLGAGLGVQFGRSAIAEIDQSFYQSWDDYHSFAQYSAAHAGTYPGEEAGLGSQQVTACIECGDRGTGRFPWLERAVFSDEELGIGPVAEYEPHDPPRYERDVVGTSVEAPLPERLARAPERMSTLERYAHYPVDAEEAAGVEANRRDLAFRESGPAPAMCGAGDDCVPVGM